LSPTIVRFTRTSRSLPPKDAMFPSVALLFALIRTVVEAQAAAPPTPPTYAETVVVTASRTEEKLLNAPASMTVVSEEQLASSPASAIAEALQTVGGLNVVQLNAREFNVTSRQASGVMTQGQLVLLDGRAVNNGNGGMHWDQLPIELD